MNPDPAQHADPLLAERTAALGAWQPISTAPHNTPILVTTGKHTVVGELRVWRNGKLLMLEPVDFSGDEWGWDFRVEELTHWIPLPAPPEAPR